MSKPTSLPKLDSAALLGRIRLAAKSGRYRFSNHALQRLQGRSVTVPEVAQVLRNGALEPSKDKLHETHQTWNYAVRGQTVDGRELRIAVTIEVNGILVITVIDLSGKPLTN